MTDIEHLSRSLEELLASHPEITHTTIDIHAHSDENASVIAWEWAGEMDTTPRVTRNGSYDHHIVESRHGNLTVRFVILEAPCDS